jgi:hypothetical protein
VRKHKQTEGMCLSYPISRLISTTRKKERKGDTCCHHEFSIGPFSVYDPANNNYSLQAKPNISEKKKKNQSRT